jgi:hypothetical protein
MVMMRFFYAMSLLAIGLCLGCSRSTTVTGPDGEKATMTQKGEGVEMTVQGKDGEKAHFKADEQGVELPEGFPTDVPLYPKSKIVTSMTIEKGKMVMLKTADSIKEIEKFYKEKLKENGWDIKISTETQDGMMLNGVKNKNVVNVVVSGKPGETMINITTAPEG